MSVSLLVTGSSIKVDWFKLVLRALICHLSEMMCLPRLADFLAANIGYVFRPRRSSTQYIYMMGQKKQTGKYGVMV